jgi:NAD(P)-dependent dehydrogenase (short-subunit alcohol dehydrogenase family)
VEQLRFDGRTAIVTGAGRGVGRAHARLLAARGAHVVVADFGGELDGSGSSADPADLVVKEIEAAGGTGIACCASVASEDGAAAIVDTAIDTFGRVDVVVNNAGISNPDWFEDLSVDQFQRMIDVHYLGTVNVTRAAWPHLRANGYGRIVNTCSEAAFGMVPKNTSYGGAKGGVFGFTRSLALDARRHGILVNAVAPRASTRLSDTKVLAHVYDAPEETFGEVMGGFAPEFVAPAAAYLAHESCQLNGEVLVAGGGQVLRMAILQTQGFTSPTLTLEELAANLDVVMDITDATLMEAEVRME